MSKKANPTTIGLFVVIGLTLAVAGLVAFSSGKWFSNTQEFVIYFNSSVRGLNQGSPVMVFGVKVGTVKEVLIHHNQKPDDVARPVIIQINEKLLKEKSDASFQIDTPATVKRLVEQGLRARLQAESFVTGLLYVDLSIHPDQPPPVYHQVAAEYIEIPSAANDIQLLMENLAGMDIHGLTSKLDDLLNKMDERLGHLQVGEISQGLTNLLGSLNNLASAPTVTNLPALLEQTLAETHKLASTLQTRVDPVADGAEETMAQARKTMEELQLAVEDLRGLLAPESPLQRDLTDTLEQLGNAAQSIGELADYLSRNPNALLSGRKPPSNKP